MAIPNQKRILKWTRECCGRGGKTIDDVSSHIDTQLLRTGSKERRKKYSISLPTFIATEGHVENSVKDPPWEADLKEVFCTLCRLFNFFIPLEYPCNVGQKFWGAVQDLIENIPRMCEISAMQEMTKRSRRFRMVKSFFVADLSHPKYADVRAGTDLELLIQYPDECATCKTQMAYSSQSDACDHLFTHHLQASPEQLSENDELDRDTYRIPSSLVEGFQHLLMMLVTTASLSKSALRNRETYADPDPVSTFLQPYESNRVGAYGSCDCRDRSHGYTDDRTDVVAYEAVGPGLALALVMGNIQSSDSRNNTVDLLDIYRESIRCLASPYSCLLGH
ncbi:Mg2+ transporter protein CorA-like/Zinc transport protein ZntB [Penicillium argentinense]|uniref:Mg2+ transporter protein CorA-like/Zinc transport protein ZntB n=1 Tax=Penicillium argentinense TaxID=1131581 RepID=A0A9W9FM20_9EURO|nr:Mg2+ transporter protein CorA-like/Zinc transport protein ZntB [Penicillium argentinense]KAJ5102729.1 Mg2+ transporter protein CorA-like/Zinc transport protein ZntB [Penicillium argentinense]